MKTIRVCIGSNDNGQNIAKSHLGDTEAFYIYDIVENLGNEFAQKRINNAKDMGHAKEDKMRAIIGLLEDVDIFVAYQKSSNFKRIAKTTKYQPVVVKANKISDILLILNRSFQEIYSYVNRRKNGEYFDTIPVYDKGTK